MQRVRLAACGETSIAESAPRMSQQVRTALGEPQRGIPPVELIRIQPPDDFPARITCIDVRGVSEILV
jgi:hypothetical protein